MIRSTWTFDLRREWTVWLLGPFALLAFAIEWWRRRRSSGPAPT